MRACLIALILYGGSASAHGGHPHSRAAAPSADTARGELARRINQAYLQRVRPIFVEKCFDCHSDQTRWPWYHRVPLVKWYLERDVAEGREHLDFSRDYPFSSHATPLEDLAAIRKEIEEGDMPPMLYRFGHADMAVSEDERKLIFDWTDWAARELKGELKN